MRARVLSPREARETTRTRDGGRRRAVAVLEVGTATGRVGNEQPRGRRRELRPVAPRRCALAAASGAAARAAETMSKKKRRDALAHVIRSRSPRLTPLFGSAEVLTIASRRQSDRLEGTIRPPLQEPPRDMSATPARVASRRGVSSRPARRAHRPASHARVRARAPSSPSSHPRGARGHLRRVVVRPISRRGGRTHRHRPFPRRPLDAHRRRARVARRPRRAARPGPRKDGRR